MSHLNFWPKWGFGNPPVDIPKMMKKQLKTSEHPRILQWVTPTPPTPSECSTFMTGTRLAVNPRTVLVLVKITFFLTVSIFCIWPGVPVSFVSRAQMEYWNWLTTGTMNGACYQPTWIGRCIKLYRLWLLLGRKLVHGVAGNSVIGDRSMYFGYQMMQLTVWEMGKLEPLISTHVHSHGGWSKGSTKNKQTNKQKHVGQSFYYPRCPKGVHTLCVHCAERKHILFLIKFKPTRVPVTWLLGYWDSTN